MIVRALVLPPLVIAAVLASSAAQAQSPLADLEFTEAIGAKCQAVAGPAPSQVPAATGTIAASDLNAALSKYAKVDPDLLFKELQAQLDVQAKPDLIKAKAVVVSELAFVAPDSDANAPAFRKLSRLAYEWVDPGAGTGRAFMPGGVFATRADGSAFDRSDAGIDASGKIVLSAALGGGGDVVFHCKPGPPPARAAVQTASASGSPESKGRWALAKTPKDLSKPRPTELPAADDKTYAELGFTDDSVKDVETYAINATAGYVFTERGVGTPFAAQGSVFVEVQRQGTDVPVKDGYVNNFNLGFGVSGRFGQSADGSGRPFRYNLTAKALSDDDFDSRAYQAALTIKPPLMIEGFDMAVGSEPWTTPLLGVEVRTWAWWSAAAAFDWMQVDDPGEKEKLKTTPRYARLGYDLNGSVLWLPTSPRAKYAVKLDVGYSLRDGQTEHGGDAQLVTAALRFLPDPRFAISLAYDRGENLDTLERIDTWKIVAGARF